LIYLDPPPLSTNPNGEKWSEREEKPLVKEEKRLQRSADIIQAIKERKKKKNKKKEDFKCFSFLSWD
jgi:hypothetical protein